MLSLFKDKRLVIVLTERANATESSQYVQAVTGETVTVTAVPNAQAGPPTL